MSRGHSHPKEPIHRPIERISRSAGCVSPTARLAIHGTKIMNDNRALMPIITLPAPSAAAQAILVLFR